MAEPQALPERELATLTTLTMLRVGEAALAKELTELRGCLIDPRGASACRPVEGRGRRLGVLRAATLRERRLRVNDSVLPGVSVWNWTLRGVVVIVFFPEFGRQSTER